MDIHDKTRIRLNSSLTDNKLVKSIKKEFNNDYFKLTFFYLAVYAIMSMVLVHGINYLSKGDLMFGDLRSEVIVVSITLMMTIATMAKRLKDDIVSNYWKLVRSRRKPRKKS